nr:MAG TPA: SenC SCO1/SenC [Caudoviricetes sp.]
MPVSFSGSGFVGSNIIITSPFFRTWCGNTCIKSI